MLASECVIEFMGLFVLEWYPPEDSGHDGAHGYTVVIQVMIIITCRLPTHFRVVAKSHICFM